MAVPSAAALQRKMSVNVRVLGAKASAANIRKMDRGMRQTFFREMIKIGEKMLERSQERYVPVLSGDLLMSASLAAHPGRYPSVEIGFGGAAVDYAVVQHENRSFNHPRGGTWKYLEKAVHDFEPEVATLLAEPLRHDIRTYDFSGKIR